MGYWPSYWQTEPGTRYFCLHGGDAVVHPDHRRQGLHTRIEAFALRGLEGGIYHFLITLAANEVTTAGNLRAGGRSVGKLRQISRRQGYQEPCLSRVSRRMPLLRPICTRLSRVVRADQSRPVVFQPFRTLDRNFPRTGNGRSRIVVEKQPRPAVMAMLADVGRKDALIRHVRDEQFFAWRYRNPSSAYRFIYLENKGLQGYLVLQQAARARSDYAFIVDWETRDMTIFSELIRAVADRGGFEWIGTWSPTLSDDQIKVLAEQGFSGENGTSGHQAFCPHLLVIPINAPDAGRMGGQDFMDISHWDLRPIYSDTY